MNQAYVVTEGETEVEILKKLLPELLAKDIVFVARPRYSLDSISSTILVDKRVPVAVVASANTDDESLIYEHQDFLQYSLRQVAAHLPFKVLFVVPAIETVFFQDQPLLEQLVNHKFTELEWEFAKSEKIINLFFRRKSIVGDAQQID
ncbi:MAG: hypothetical protein DRR19_33345 [Candidatus Parabeggiatoa sp. nov. 1]|nr:MAG: hypothetical protein DRR19_33345 [Gammaproteobacteria bacterium]